MYAVVEISGKQYKVAPKDTIDVPSQTGKAGDLLNFDRVLLVGDDGKLTVGNPMVKGMKVQAKILNHGKDDKVIVFKKKKRKGYRVKKGHRQGFTHVEITSIGL
jgi:large subunit ribosomal protein L21